jgi:hypothetical protein
LKRYTSSEIEWVGEEQVNRPLPDLVHGQQMWEVTVEAIKGRKLDTRMEVVYDTRAIAEGKAEAEAVGAAVERKEGGSEEGVKRGGAWGPAQVTSRAFTSPPPSQPGKTRKVKARKEARQVEGVRPGVIRE